MYVPLVVFLLGCLTRGNPDPQVATALLWLNILLIVAGFGLGIFALVSIRQYGPERIVGRAIIGVVLNGAALAMLFVMVMPLMNTGNVKKQVVGHWRLTSTP